MSGQKRVRKTGSKVRLVNQGDEVYMIIKWQMINNRMFYSLAELPGALFLRESLETA